MAEGKGYGKCDLVKPSENSIHKRWLISLIILPFGVFFIFLIALSGTGYSDSMNLLVSWGAIIIVMALCAWLLIESMIFYKKDRDALPLGLITMLISINILFVLVLQILFNGLGFAVPEFSQNGRGFYFMITALIFLGLVIWTIIKGIVLIKGGKTKLGIVSLIVGEITGVVSLWFIRGALYIFSNT